jgi:glycerol-3-phosphate acyltransferase PlsX
MRLGLDVMGGDFAPKVALQGLVMALPNLSPEKQVFLFGDERYINEFLNQHQIVDSRIHIIPTTNEILMGEHAVKSISSKTSSAIVTGIGYLAKGLMDVFVSAGNTGAVYAAAYHIIKPIESGIRPALMSEVPRESGKTAILLDVGANADCKAETLVDFARLGYITSKYVYHVENPRVGLLNIGKEPEKGNKLTQEAYQLLAKAKNINFIGNVESFDLFSEEIDVFVCDGFTGNILLKTSEAIFQQMRKRNFVDSFFQRFNMETFGAFPILGINKPVLVAHGVSNEKVFAKMLESAAHIVESKLSEKLISQYQALDVK